MELNLAFPLITLLTDSRKSFSVANFLLALSCQQYSEENEYLIANIPASVQTDRNSAPVALGQSREISSNRISLSTLILPLPKSNLNSHTSLREFSKYVSDPQHQED